MTLLITHSSGLVFFLPQDFLEVKSWKRRLIWNGWVRRSLWHSFLKIPFLRMNCIVSLWSTKRILLFAVLFWIRQHGFSFWTNFPRVLTRQFAMRQTAAKKLLTIRLSDHFRNNSVRGKKHILKKGECAFCIFIK